MTYQDFEQLWEREIKSELLGLEDMRKKQRRAIVLGVSVSILMTVVLASLVRGIEIGLPFAVSAGAGYLVFHSVRPAGYRKLYKEKVISALTKRTKYGWMPDLSFYDQLFAPRAQTESIRALFNASGLYHSSVTTFTVDEVFVPSGPTSRMAEINVVRGSGKNSQLIFKGLLFYFDVSKAFSGETYIRAEKEFFLGVPMGSNASRSFFSSTLKTTKLEWNDFEKLLEVQTTDETEAREILDPQFMEVLYGWWSEHKKSVRLSFKGQHMYLSVPFLNNMFEPSLFSSMESHKKDLWMYLGAFLLAEQLFIHVERKYRLDIQKVKTT